MKRDATKLAYWSEHIKKWQASGLAQRAYCQQEDIKWPTFDYWRRQILATVVTSQPAKKNATADLTLVPVRVVDKQRHDTTILRHPAGWELCLPGTVDAAWLAEMLKCLV